LENSYFGLEPKWRGTTDGVIVRHITPPPDERGQCHAGQGRAGIVHDKFHAAKYRGSITPSIASPTA
jgi:hypothetical protein